MAIPLSLIDGEIEKDPLRFEGLFGVEGQAYICVTYVCITESGDEA